MNQAQNQSQNKGFDLDQLDNDQVITHSVAVLQDDDGNDVTGFIIVGKNSPEYQEASKSVRINNIKRASRRKGQIDSASDVGAALIAKTVEEGDRALALSVVIGWFGMLKNGQLMKFDKEVVAKMFQKYPQWQAKVLAALEDDANFMKP